MIEDNFENNSLILPKMSNLSSSFNFNNNNSNNSSSDSDLLLQTHEIQQPIQIQRETQNDVNNTLPLGSVSRNYSNHSMNSSISNSTFFFLFACVCVCVCQICNAFFLFYFFFFIFAPKK